MDILERQPLIDRLTATFAAVKEGTGAMVAVVGEAGVGKTTLVRAALDDLAGQAEVWWGACDPLGTPRPFGPLHDMARHVPELAAALAAPRREEVFSGFLDALDAKLRPRVMVVEDAQWADEATLDFLTLLGRRLDRIAAMVVVTFRDGTEAWEGIRPVLGYLPAGTVTTLEVQPLSPAGVEEWAQRAGRSPAGLHALTGGNPFFVSQLLDSDQQIPPSVTGVVTARLSRLSPAARRAAQVAAVSPVGVEPETLSAMGCQLDAVDELVADGVLALDGALLRFRHELARLAIADSLTRPGASTLHGQLLALLHDRPGVDTARLAHHALGSGDPEAILRYSRAAGGEAAAAGSHREAARHLAAALEHADGMPPAERAELAREFSTEAYIANRAEDAVVARRVAAELWTQAGDSKEAGADLCALSRLAWWAGHRREADVACGRAIATLEGLAPSPALAEAYAQRAQLMLMEHRLAEALEWGERALALAEELGDATSATLALGTVGNARLRAGDDSGLELLEKAFQLADGRRLTEPAGSILMQLAWAHLERFRMAEAGPAIQRALDYARDHLLDGYAQYLLAWRALWHFYQGRWNESQDDAEEMLRLGEQPGISLCPALTARGRLAARRGEADEALRYLERAWELAVRADEVLRMAPVAAGISELGWLTGRPELGRPYLEAALAKAEGGEAPWFHAELALWAHRIGLDPQRPVDPDARPFALMLQGEPEAAAEGWRERSCRYEWADALADSDDPDRLSQALEVLSELGAEPRAAMVRRRLRQLGISPPRRPRRATRENLLGLTPRQAEIGALLAEGLTNAEIAERLVVSVRTVDHHVSAVLQKLGVSNRREAVRELRRQDAL